MKTRLHRSRTDQHLAGVCGGLGESLGIDPTWLRLGFVLFTLAGGSGILLYLVLWFILPYPEQEPGSGDTIRQGAEEIADRARQAADGMRGLDRHSSQVLGIGLILLGVFFGLRHLDLLWWLDFGTLWPLLLILAGGFVFVQNRGANGDRQHAGLTEAGLLVVAGIFFLLRNLGLINLDWETIWQFWPALLIVLGVLMLMGRHSGLSTFLVVLLVLAIVFVAVTGALQFRRPARWSVMQGAEGAAMVLQRTVPPAEG